MDLLTLANKYEQPKFILEDPVQFPRMFLKQESIEIIGIISSWLAYGSRRDFIPIIGKLIDKMVMKKGSLYSYIMEYDCREFEPDREKRLYRFYKYDDFIQLCCQLRRVYGKHETLEDAVLSTGLHPLQGLIKLFEGRVKGIPGNDKSACKRLNMFLRWMIRKNSTVDIGCWQKFDPACLLIPLDTHVARIGRQLGLITRKENDMKTVIQLTQKCAEICPNDPCYLDFALYGYGIENKNVR